MKTSSGKRDRRRTAIPQLDDRVLQRLLSRSVTTPEGCWEWTGGVDAYGYGRLSVSDRMVSAHRTMYVLTVGPIAAGMTIDHLCHTNHPSCRKGTSCRHRRCLNPGHMEMVSALENQRRSKEGAPPVWLEEEGRCVRGHDMTAENTYRNGVRVRCRTCTRASNRASELRKRGAA